MQSRAVLVAAALLSVGAALPVGAVAPAFELPSSTGGKLGPQSFRGKGHGDRTVVLAFFPKAFTGG
jgi:peroxiredoxin